MSSAKSLTSGVKFGLLAGLVYVVLLLVQYLYAATNPATFALFKVVTYFIILGVFVFAGLARRKELGGYADFKSILQTLIIAIAITELVYGIFNYVYLNFIDPQFFDKFLNNTMSWLEKKGISQEDIDSQLEMYKSNSAPPTIGGTFFGIAVWIVIDCVFGIIIAAALRKNKPPFENSFNQ